MKVAVASGPVHSSLAAQASQVYSSPAFTTISGDHWVPVSPAGISGLRSLSLEAFWISKTYRAVDFSGLSMFRTARVTLPSGTELPSWGDTRAGMESRFRGGGFWGSSPTLVRPMFTT